MAPIADPWLTACEVDSTIHQGVTHVQIGYQQEAFSLLMACGILFCVYNTYMTAIEGSVDSVILTTMAAGFEWVAISTLKVLQVLCLLLLCEWLCMP